jgi:hypothetical protein
LSAYLKAKLAPSFKSHLPKLNNIFFHSILFTSHIFIIFFLSTQ